MRLRAWLKVLAQRGGVGARGRRTWRQRLLVEEFESRALPSANPAYTEVTGAANPFNGFDIGTYSVPKLADLDGDGDFDLCVGETNGAFFYFENTGTAGAPTFVQRTGAANPFNGFDVGSYSSPAFGDLDGDGDLDLVSGTQPGTLLYYENTGTASAPTFVQRTGGANPFNGLDVGNFSIPDLGDVDADGDLDMVSGDTVGKLHYFENTGTTSAPAFVERTGAANPLNGFDVGAAGSTPALGDVDADGDLDLISGESSGVQFYFRNTGTTSSPAFAQQTGANNPFNGFDVGSFSAPAFGDLNGDGALDLVSGNSFGSLNYYQSAPGLATSASSLNLGTTTAGTAGMPQTFTVSGIALSANIVVAAPTGVELSTDGTTWTTSVMLTPTGGKVANTLISARITAGASVGAVSGNITVSSTNATTQNVAVTGTVNAADSTAPTATVTTPAPSITAATGGTSTVTITVTYADAGSEVNTSTFGTDDITVTNGATVTGFLAAGNVVTYTITAPAATWAASTQGTYTIALVAGAVTDLAGNPVAANPSLGTFAVDTTVPTAAVTTPAPAITAASGGTSTVAITVTYADTGSGVDTSTFGTDDITVTNGATVTGFLAAGNVVTYTITAPAATWSASAQGTYTIALVAGAVTDLAGNPVAANPSLGTFAVDTTVPTAAVTTPAPAITAATGGTNTVTVTVTYADTGSGVDTSTFGTGDITVTNGATVTGFSAAGNVVTYTITAPAATWSASAQGTYTIALVAGAVTDLAGNPVAANPSLGTFTVDTTVPTAAVTTPAPSITAAFGGTNTVTVTVTYADTGSGVDAATFGTGDITVTNGATVTGFSAAGNVVTYTITAPAATWSASAQGTYTIALAAGAVTDLAGNPVAANAALGTFTVDTQAKPALVTSVPTGNPAGTAVRIIDPVTGQLIRTLIPFAGFVGSVDLASGDFNRDGVADLLVAAGAGGGPHIKVFNGGDGGELASFFAYDVRFVGGVSVAIGDVNGDGTLDIITGAGAGAGPHVKAFDGRTFAEVRSFFAYDTGFRGGVSVAAGDVNGDGFDDIITGTGAGGASHVKVFGGADGAVLLSFFAYPAFGGGVSVAAGDVNGDGFDDIITGSSQGPHVKVFDGRTGQTRASFFGFDAGFTGGVRVGTADADGDGKADIVAAAGPGGGPHLTVFDGESLAVLRSEFVGSPTLRDGLIVG
ncbi:FG-GAP repeat protein [Gemmata obscuriglobus]|uniref:Bacterial Ig-like domain-containing protein n=1 Tax=Gemmata obscuriglobus TaxID=114 RepID=A0A2Z3H1V3_9BACT|nr:VCBS repeat-containing protein [Gemmata obscuriglobus]AWM40013.1 hypothetical protein C1280_25425 [Gemmata obscuriglobus]QEG26832.1 FG-GAP repeat protein [Gemmata obscuriglobus]VTS02786.1 Flagellar hook-length control protein FliK OS=Synechocystis sp. (strain PCC 6714) GN=D082_14820 PE=4 SV=1: VCBS: VCBS: VCBS: VCBS [Gemmata obscuriglobus UQM 2246]